jgi:hypothetical protein
MMMPTPKITGVATSTTACRMMRNWLSPDCRLAAKLQESVFDNNDRAIHHQTNSNGQAAERHQVGGNAQLGSWQ